MSSLSMTSTRNALVVGGTGLVGHELLTLLEEDQRYERIIHLGRRQPELPEHSRIETRVLNLSHLAEVTDLPDDRPLHGFCCLGTTIKKAGSRASFRQVDYEFVMEFARLCKRANAEHLSVVSAIGSKAQSPFYYSRIKGETEDALIDLALPSLAILRPSLLLGERRDDFRLGEELAKLLNPLLLGPLAPWRGVDAFDVARAMLIAAESPQAGVEIISSQQIRNLAPFAAR